MKTELQGSSLELPTGYYLERDPDLLILRRLDGAMVGAFSARGAVPETVRQTAVETIEEDDQWQLPADRNHTPKNGRANSANGSSGSSSSSSALLSSPSTLRGVSSATSSCSATKNSSPWGATARP
jgi:hypothetical protein